MGELSLRKGQCSYQVWQRGSAKVMDSSWDVKLDGALERHGCEVVEAVAP